jgi:phosphatidylglycerophosphatase A
MARFIKQKKIVDENFKISFLVRAIGSGLFTGYIPVASGTFGSLVGMFIFLVPGFSDFRILTIAIIIFFIAGVYISEIMVKRYGDDPAQVVIDEIVGLWFTYFIGYIVFEFFIQFKTYDPTQDFLRKVLFALVGFFIFRIFDIIKFQPAKYFDEYNNGYGIMMDDIAAGFYSGILSAITTHFIWYRIFAKLHL